VRGMVKLMGTMQEVRKVNPDLPPPRIVACRTDNTTVGRAIEEGLRKKFGGNVFQAAIPRGKDVPAAHAARRPLPFHAPTGEAAARGERAGSGGVACVRGRGNRRAGTQAGASGGRKPRARWGTARGAPATGRDAPYPPPSMTG